jgi:hypothetical protein
MYTDSSIKNNVFISLMKLKNRDNQKYLQTHEGAGLCFHKNQNWKSPNFYKFCWELTDLSKNLELFKMHQFNYSVCSYTFIEIK